MKPWSMVAVLALGSCGKGGSSGPPAPAPSTLTLTFLPPEVSYERDEVTFHVQHSLPEGARFFFATTTIEGKSDQSDAEQPVAHVSMTLSKLPLGKHTYEAALTAKFSTIDERRKVVDFTAEGKASLEFEHLPPPPVLAIAAPKGKGPELDVVFGEAGRGKGRLEEAVLLVEITAPPGTKLEIGGQPFVAETQAISARIDLAGPLADVDPAVIVRETAPGAMEYLYGPLGVGVPWKVVGPDGGVLEGQLAVLARDLVPAVFAAASSHPVAFPGDAAGKPALLYVSGASRPGFALFGAATSMRQVGLLATRTTTHDEASSCEYEDFSVKRTVVTETVTVIDRRAGKVVAKKVIKGHAGPCPTHDYAKAGETVREDDLYGEGSIDAWVQEYAAK